MQVTLGDLLKPSTLTVATVLCAVAAGAVSAEDGPKWLRIALLGLAVALIVLDLVLRHRRKRSAARPEPSVDGSAVSGARRDAES